ncbi:MAG: aminopeptidase, partial [Calditrichaeota bacterium]|nr:aminopeptidase [Calditrichota bacterium]
MPVVQIQKWMKIMVIFSLIAMSGCTDNAAPETLRDPHSFAHADEVVMTHLDWDAAIDFAEHRIVAKASIHVKNKTGAKRLFFDSRDLTIDKITLGEDEIETTFSIGETIEYMG